MADASTLLVDGLLQTQDGASTDVIARALRAIRAHLGMDIAYVSEFVGDRSVFREVDAPGHEGTIWPGHSLAIEDIYCRHILEGRLPELIRDVSAEPLAMSIPLTHTYGIGKHLSVPVRLPSGELYGMFCCLGFSPDPSLQQRDLQMMRAFAELAAHEIHREREARRSAEERTARVRKVIDEQSFTLVFQPIWNVETRAPIGLECLTRFTAAPSRSPDIWFNEAADVGLGAALELAAIRHALSAVAALPANIYLAINASPHTILSAEFTAMMQSVPPAQVVLEITEHAGVGDYENLLAALRPHRDRGVRIAVDDAGAGYSSLRHILNLRPDIIKLDMSLTRNICLDPARRALAAALTGFARETDCLIVAEGVETPAEFATLKALGIEKVQGYLLGRPLPLEPTLRLLQRGAAANTSSVA